VVRNVNKAYSDIREIQSSLDASQEAVTFYEELSRVVTNYVFQQLKLESDSLQVKAKLPQQQATLIKLQDALDTQKENLNDLIGRDIQIDYQVKSSSGKTY
jgi:outer membrane protein TolC